MLVTRIRIYKMLYIWITFSSFFWTTNSSSLDTYERYIMICSLSVIPLTVFLFKMTFNFKVGVIILSF